MVSDFEKRMRAIGQQVVDGANRVKKETAIAILAGLVQIQPKDTGEATAGWKIGVGQLDASPVAFIRGIKGSSGQANADIALARGKTAVEAAQPGQPVHVGNIVPWVHYNNAGNSRQAPAGYVENEVTKARYGLRKAKIFPKVKRGRTA